MDIPLFCRLYPRVYHVAHEEAWPGIRRRGLLSTSALLDLFEVCGPVREQVEAQRRPQSVAITHPVHGSAVIRDQKPLSEAKLLRCLEDMSPRQWYEALNRRVFFWCTRHDMLGMQMARAYRDHVNLIITVDSRALLLAHHERCILARINTGATRFPTPRGTKTFCPFSEWPPDIRPRALDLRWPPKELAVDYAVPDAVNMVVGIEKMRNGVLLETLLPSP